MQTTNSASPSTCNQHPRLRPRFSRALLTNSLFPSAKPIIYSIPGIYPRGGCELQSPVKLTPNLPPPALSGAAHD
jgi:hypothetical protein